MKKPTATENKGSTTPILYLSANVSSFGIQGKKIGP
jgi:hypothetical protein